MYEYMQMWSSTFYCVQGVLFVFRQSNIPSGCCQSPVPLLVVFGLWICWCEQVQTGQSLQLHCVYVKADNAVQFSSSSQYTGHVLWGSFVCFVSYFIFFVLFMCVACRGVVCSLSVHSVQACCCVGQAVVGRGASQEATSFQRQLSRPICGTGASAVLVLF